MGFIINPLLLRLLARHDIIEKRKEWLETCNKEQQKEKIKKQEIRYVNISIGFLGILKKTRVTQFKPCLKSKVITNCNSFHYSRVFILVD